MPSEPDVVGTVVSGTTVPDPAVVDAGADVEVSPLAPQAAMAMARNTIRGINKRDRIAPRELSFV